MKLVASTLQVSEPRGKRPACERGFEREVLTLIRELAHSLQHDAASRNSDRLGREGR